MMNNLNVYGAAEVWSYDAPEFDGKMVYIRYRGERAEKRFFYTDFKRDRYCVVGWLDDFIARVDASHEAIIQEWVDLTP